MNTQSLAILSLFIQFTVRVASESSLFVVMGSVLAEVTMTMKYVTSEVIALMDQMKFDVALVRA